MSRKTGALLAELMAMGVMSDMSDYNGDWTVSLRPNRGRRKTVLTKKQKKSRAAAKKASKSRRRK